MGSITYISSPQSRAYRGLSINTKKSPVIELPSFNHEVLWLNGVTTQGRVIF